MTDEKTTLTPTGFTCSVCGTTFTVTANWVTLERALHEREICTR